MDNSVSLDRIRIEQIRVLMHSAPLGVVSALFGGMVLTFILVYGEWVAIKPALYWIGVLFIVAVLHLLLCLSYIKQPLIPSQWQLWALGFSSISLLEGLIWGPGAIFLILSPSLEGQLLVLLVSSAVASNTVAAFGSYLPAVYVLFFSTMLPFLLWAILQAGAVYYALSLLLAIFLIGIGILALRANQIFVESLRLRFENFDLAENLRHQKEIAEEANLSKSRFLAAASHDLRQPVQVISLFLGALRSRSLDSESKDLVDHLDASVLTLDKLFVALLDISKLDAKVVQINNQAFKLQPLLDRVCNDYEKEAESKGLRFVQHKSSASLYADPVHLERILRNLISNAVRYTHKGRIVVGCRIGTFLDIQVWDTGKGILTEELKWIFQEYYQIDNPERNRQQGLGLGLAIVKKLSDLMACKIDVQSTPGKGSVFTVSVSCTSFLVTEYLPQTALAHEEITRTGFILVIDDDIAIQNRDANIARKLGA